MNIEKKKILFCYPSRSIGGAQLLFARLASMLIQKGYDIAVIDYNDGFVYNFLKKHNVEFIEFKDRVFLECDYFFIVSLDFWPYLIDRIIPSEKSQFLFWDLHPFNLVSTTKFAYIYLNLPVKLVKAFLGLTDFKRRIKIKRFLEEGINNNGIVFMAYSNANIIKQIFKFRESLESVKFLPIALPSVDSNAFTSYNERVDVGFISRLESDKVRSFLIFLKELNKAINLKELKKKIVFHIIGCGKAESELISEIKKYGFSYIYLGKIHGSDLDSYLVDNIDLGIGMGTTALEFSKLKIPFLLLEGGVKENIFNNWNGKYIYFHNVFGNEVSVTSYGSRNNKFILISDIVNLLTCDDTNMKLKEYGELCYNHFKENHSLDVLLKNVLNISELNTFTIKNIRHSKILKLTMIEIIVKNLKIFLKSIRGLN